jgi:hypothetical protein
LGIAINHSRELGGDRPGYCTNPHHLGLPNTTYRATNTHKTNIPTDLLILEVYNMVQPFFLLGPRYSGLGLALLALSLLLVQHAQAVRHSTLGYGVGAGTYVQLAHWVPYMQTTWVVDASGKGNFTSLDAISSTKVKPGDIVYMRGTGCSLDLDSVQCYFNFNLYSTQGRSPRCRPCRTSMYVHVVSPGGTTKAI